MTENTCSPFIFQTGKPGTRQNCGETLQHIQLKVIKSMGEEEEEIK